MKQTAVELLKQRLIKDQQIFPIYTEYINGILYDIDNELLEMEKQQQGYSEEEVYKLTLEALDLGMRIRQDQLSGYSEKSGKELHKEWFETFKNK